MNIFEKIAEERIREAIERGDFDCLEGKGKPLPPDEWGIKVAPEVRVAYKILKNANVLPVEIQTLKEIERIEELLPALDNEDERYQYVRRMNALITKFNIMRKAPVSLERNQYYVNKLGKRFMKE